MFERGTAAIPIEAIQWQQSGPELADWLRDPLSNSSPVISVDLDLRRRLQHGVLDHSLVGALRSLLN